MTALQQEDKLFRKIRDRINCLHIAQGYTYKKLGEKLGYSTSMVQKWDAGKHVPRKKQLILERLERLDGSHRD